MICDKCKHYYNLHTSWINDEHEACNEEFCYLCAYKHGECPGFEEGDVPENEERGAVWEENED